MLVSLLNVGKTDVCVYLEMGLKRFKQQWQYPTTEDLVPYVILVIVRQKLSL